MEGGAVAVQKAHHASRNKAKKKAVNSGTGGKKNAVAKPGAFQRRIKLATDRSEKRAANPTAPVDRTRVEAIPRVCAVVGPAGVGKHPYILADRVEDITPSRLPDTANRQVAAYG